MPQALKAFQEKTRFIQIYICNLINFPIAENNILKPLPVHVNGAEN